MAKEKESVVNAMTDAEREDRRAFIQKYQRLCAVCCVIVPMVATYMQPDPTSGQTLRSFFIRFLEAVIVYVPISYYGFGKTWDAYHKSRGATQ